jgi:hypothetical protein
MKFSGEDAPIRENSFDLTRSLHLAPANALDCG